MNSPLVASLTTISTIFFSQGTTAQSMTNISYCEKNSTCKYFATEVLRKGVFPYCRNSARGDVGSKKVCAIIFVKNPNFGYNVIPDILSPTKCQQDDLARPACETYAKTYSPDEGIDEPSGKPYRSCQSNIQPYLCTEGKKKYVTCSVQASPAKGNCK